MIETEKEGVKVRDEKIGMENGDVSEVFLSAKCSNFWRNLILRRNFFHLVTHCYKALQQQDGTVRPLRSIK